MDQNLSHQQNLGALGIAVVLLSAKSNRLVDLRPLVPAMLAAIAQARGGEVRRVGA
jgi:hypothetical protein